MTMQFTAIMFEHLNFVMTMLLVGTCMEIACVLVPFKSHSHFTQLPPKHQLGINGPTENGDNEATEVMFRG